jgi:hypothetical protein
MDILGFPLALPELFFIPFYFYFKNKIDLRVNKKVFIIGLSLIIFLIAISFLVDNYRPSSVLSTARGYFHIVLFFSIFINKKIENIRYIMFIAFGSVLGWLFESVTFVNELIRDVMFDKTSAVYGNMIMVSLAMSIPLIFKKTKYVYLALVIGMLLSFSSGIRRLILIFLTSFAFSFFLAIERSFIGISKALIIFMMSFSFIILIFPIAEEAVYNVSPTLFKRVFVKSEQFIMGEENYGDNVRKNSIMEFSNSFEENLLPRGFVTKRTMQDKDAGLYMDSPYYEIFYTFGIGGALLFFVLFTRKILFHFKNYFLYNVKESAVCIVSASTIIILIMIEGSFLNFAYVTPCTGFVLARIFSNNNLIIN